jgi:hypothetical protein
MFPAAYWKLPPLETYLGEVVVLFWPEQEKFDSELPLV